MGLRLPVEEPSERLEDVGVAVVAYESETRIDDKGIGAMSTTRLCSLACGLMVGGANAWASNSWDACCDSEKSCKGSKVEAESCGMSGQEFVS